MPRPARRRLFTLCPTLLTLLLLPLLLLPSGGCYADAVEAVYAKGGQTAQEGLFIPSTSVTFAGQDLTDDDLRQLLPHLNALRTFHLTLRNTAVTDASIPTLLRLRNLGGLAVEGTAMTPAGLSRLAGLPTLHVLTVGGLTPTEVRQLAAALPGIEIRDADADRAMLRRMRGTP